MGQIRTWQPVQNSAPIRRRLVEKPLKTGLFHQNDYQWPKNRKVAYLYFRCDHFEGHMSHLLRTAKKKSTRSAINTLVSRELRFGGYPSRRSRITTAPAGEIEQAGERCTRWGCTDAQMRTGGTRSTKAKRPFKGGEGENHENTGATAPAPAARLRFCGPSRTKTEPSGFCLMLLAHYGCPMGQKALSDGEQVYMPNMAKIWQNLPKNAQNWR